MMGRTFFKNRENADIHRSIYMYNNVGRKLGFVDLLPPVALGTGESECDFKGVHI